MPAFTDTSPHYDTIPNSVSDFASLCHNLDSGLKKNSGSLEACMGMIYVGGLHLTWTEERGRRVDVDGVPAVVVVLWNLGVGEREYHL